MTCGCSGEEYVDASDCDATLLWSAFQVRSTRKPHRCVECGDPISVGSRCCGFSGLCEGKFFRYYRCLTCAALVEFISTKHEICVNVLGTLQDACSDLGIDWTDWREAAEPKP